MNDSFSNLLVLNYGRGNTHVLNLVVSSEVVKEVDQTNHYCRTSLFQRKGGENFIKQFALKKGQKILDLGSGTDYLTHVLAGRVSSEGKVLGIDEWMLYLLIM